MSGRKATHVRSGLEYLDDCAGMETKEDDLKNLLIALNKNRDDDHFKPRRNTKEEYRISRELIDILVALQWPLGEGDPYRLLKDDRQSELDLSAA